MVDETTGRVEAPAGSPIYHLTLQPHDSDLDIWAGITPSADVQTFVSAANFAAMRTAIGLGTGNSPTFAGLVYNGATSGTVTVSPQAISGTTVIKFPVITAQANFATFGGTQTPNNSTIWDWNNGDSLTFKSSGGTGTMQFIDGGKLNLGVNGTLEINASVAITQTGANIPAYSLWTTGATAGRFVPLANGFTNQVLHANTSGVQTYSAVVEADLGLTDITTANSSTTKHGFLPKLDNTAGHYLDGTGAWGTVPNAPPAQFFGSGTDGAISSGAGTTTLTRDMFYTNVTLGAGDKLVTKNFHVYISGTLNVASADALAIVSGTGNDGGNSTTITAGTQPTNNTSNGSLGTGGLGASGKGGSTTTGINGSAGTAVAVGAGGAGGASGAGGTGVGGTIAGGTSAAGGLITAIAHHYRLDVNMLRGATLIGGGGSGATGGSGGGAGGAQSGGSGGSGNGGNVLFVAANAINRGGSTTASCFSAAGGAGGNGGNGNANTAGGGGGSGGGGGGIVYLIYGSLTGSSSTNSVDASGGNGGTGGNGLTTGIGGNGGTGGNGGCVIIINVTAGTFSITDNTATAAAAASAGSGTTGGAGSSGVSTKTNL